jgi:hypothetical protein
MQRPTLKLESAGTLLFDGLQAVCWFVNMGSSILSPRVTNISPGQLYTFAFTQNAVGGHTMNWPPNCINAGPLDPTPYSTTTFTFVGNTGGLLYANISPTWSSTGGQP